MNSSGYMLKPKISIVVPVYKTEAFIGQCVESLINQSFKEIEIILVNDGSPDNAGKICEKFAEKDSRVKVYHQQNQGGCVAMWNGANYATAPFLMYLDGDDWLEKEACEKAYNSMVSTNADVVFWSYIKEYPNGKSKKPITIFNNKKVFIGQQLTSLKRRFIGLSNKELRNPTLTDALSSCWAKLYRRELILNDKWCMVDKNGNHSFDSLINIRLFKEVKKAVYLPAYLNHYRQYNPNSATKTHKLLLLDKYLVLFENIESFIKENNLDLSFSTALNNRIALSVINNALSITSPHLEMHISNRIKQLKKVLNNAKYATAIKQLNLKYLPLHWKIYFLLSKKKSVISVYLLTLLIRKIR